MGVNRRGQFLIASGVLRPAKTDMDANRVEAGPDTGNKSWTPAAAKFTRETDSPAEGGGFEPRSPP